LAGAESLHAGAGGVCRIPDTPEMGRNEKRLHKGGLLHDRHSAEIPRERTGRRRRAPGGGKNGRPGRPGGGSDHGAQPAVDRSGRKTEDTDDFEKQNMNEYLSKASQRKPLSREKEAELNEKRLAGCERARREMI